MKTLEEIQEAYNPDIEIRQKLTALSLLIKAEGFDVEVKDARNVVYSNELVEVTATGLEDMRVIFRFNVLAFKKRPFEIDASLDHIKVAFDEFKYYVKSILK